MKPLILFLLLAIAGTTVTAQTTDELLQKANAAYQKKDYANSASLFSQAIEKGAENAGDYYNAACSYALAGDKQSAFAFLEGAVKKGWTNAGHLQRDSDLKSLHEDSRWPALVEKAKISEASAKRLWDSPALKVPYKAELSAAEKVAGVSKIWSEVKYNFVNFDLVPQLSWDSLYVSTLNQVAETKTTADYYRVLMKMIAQLRDGHTNVYPANELHAEFFAQPALRTRLVEDKVVVIAVYDDALKAQGITVGTELVSINSTPVKEYAAKYITPFQSASTPHDLDVRTYEYSLLRGPINETVAVGFKNARGKTFNADLKRMSFEEIRKVMPKTPPFRLTWLKGNIAHVELNSFGNDEAANEYLKHFPEIAKADAIIFDVRNNGGGNSTVGYKVLSTLTDKPLQTSSWYTRVYRPSYRAWGNAEGRTGGNNNTYPADGKLLYTKPVVVLTSPRTYSAAEDFAIAFDVMDRGKMLGETTGGSTGQPLMFDLPGGGIARVCTKRDTYPDGKEFVGVGVLPDVSIKPTVADLRKNKDTVLEAAVNVLMR
ncbi:MAG TPA: S41 family peptidase [Sphingobacteriaceae bacterium]